ncbi:MAG: hypothetical protein GY803_29245 [Chloroflexi bacterium]|nr:hypothetical protein [Chloroflexota bacterium]
MIVLGRVIVGLGMLALGRQLFWLFIGGIGFVFGLNLAASMFAGQPETTALMFALIVGVICAVGALVLQKLAVGVSGFFGGAIIAVQLVEAFALNVGSPFVPFLLGGILGLVLVSVLFDWALIVLSSVAGAQVIVDAVGWERPLSLVMIAVFAAVGIAIQASQMQREGRSS